MEVAVAPHVSTEKTTTTSTKTPKPFRSSSNPGRIKLPLWMKKEYGRFMKPKLYETEEEVNESTSFSTEAPKRSKQPEVVTGTGLAHRDVPTKVRYLIL